MRKQFNLSQCLKSIRQLFKPKGSEPKGQLYYKLVCTRVDKTTKLLLKECCQKHNSIDGPETTSYYQTSYIKTLLWGGGMIALCHLTKGVADIFRRVHPQPPHLTPTSSDPSVPHLYGTRRFQYKTIITRLPLQVVKASPVNKAQFVDGVYS